MKALISAVSISLLFAALSAFAQSATPAPSPAGNPAQAMTEMSDGEVRKVDRDARKITLRHPEIKQLDMPAMTMVFRVKDAALLDKVKTGDKVRFRAEADKGALTITEIEVSK